MDEDSYVIPRDAPIWKRRLYHLWKQSGDSWRGVSRTAGLGESYLRDVFNKDSAPTVTKLQRLADYHGVDLAWFFVEDDDSDDARLIAALHAAFRELSPAMRDFLLKSARDLLEAQRQDAQPKRPMPGALAEK